MHLRHNNMKLTSSQPLILQSSRLLRPAKVSQSAQEYRWLPGAKGFLQWPSIIYTRGGAWLTSHPYPSSYPSAPWLFTPLNWALLPLKALIWAVLSTVLPYQYRSPPPPHLSTWKLPVQQVKVDTRWLSDNDLSNALNLERRFAITFSDYEI
jgi:hypothetical protein